MERMAAPRSCGKAEARACEREEERFCENLSREAKAAGTQGETRGEFGLAHGCAGKQKVGHVGTDDEKQKHAHAHEDAQRADEQALRSVWRLPKRQQCGAHALAYVGV